MNCDLVQKVVCQMVVNEKFRNLILSHSGDLADDVVDRVNTIFDFCRDNSIIINGNHVDQIRLLLSIQADTQEEFAQEIERRLEIIKSRPSGHERFVTDDPLFDLRRRK